MKARIFKAIGASIGIILFVLALWVLQTELHKYHLHEILRDLHNIPLRRFIMAALLTVVSYGIMTGYDFLALRYIERPLGCRKIATASFLGYAFSNNMGFSLLAGASVRYRLYSSWGLSGVEIAKVIFFCTVSIWLGFLTLGSGVFLLEPFALPAAFHFPFLNGRPLGMLLIIPVIVYLVMDLMHLRTFKVRDFEINLPSSNLLLPQIGLATIDWAIAGSILYVLLPPSIPYAYFLGIYLLAQFAGLVSQVPGGLGVFEAMVLVFLSPFLPAPTIIGTLVIYRVTYYLLPLLVAALILGIEEVIQRREIFQRGAQAISRWLPYMVPPIITVITFLSGVVLLFSGATPEVGSRLRLLSNFFPLPVIELSHFLGSIVGIALIILARGLLRRIDTAYYLTVAFVAGGVVLSLLKGFDYEEASILIVMLLILLPSKPSFYRKGSLFEGKFTAGWLLVIIIVLISTAWLAFFSYKHVEYSSDLWWRFAFTENAPRSLRAVVGALVAALIYGLAKILHPYSPTPSSGSRVDMERALPVIRESLECYANLALLGDKAFLFSENGKAFIMYAISGKSWIVMGDPIGPEEEWSELVWRFCEMCDRFGEWPVFHEVGSRNLYVYIDIGMTLIKLGEEGRVDLSTFTLEGRLNKELRHTFNKISRAGCTFELVQPRALPAIMPELRKVSDAWLMEKHTREKGFSLGSFQEDYIEKFPVGVIRQGGEIIAFANVWTSGEKEELSADLMRYTTAAPSGVMDYLFTHLMIWGRDNGYRWFNLGMAPLSGLEEKLMTSIWSHIGDFVFQHAQHFYNFQGLRQYKEKFSPQWRPRYLASPTTLSLPIVLANIATLTSGGIKGIVSK
jgi:phosphatidylglycerol lysyltransferase